MNPIPPRQPDPPPPAREEPPKPKEPEPESDDIGKIGDKISDAADEVADKVEKFAELIEDRQEDINEAVETFREIGRALVATGRGTGGIMGVGPDGSTYDPRVGASFGVPPIGPSPPPPPNESDSDLNPWPLRDEIDAAVRGAINRLELEENNPGDAPSVETTHSAEGVILESEPAEESDEGLPPWLPWAVAGGVGIWGVTRKKT